MEGNERGRRTKVRGEENELRGAEKKRGGGTGLIRKIRRKKGAGN